jgi:hypothetical protein
MKGHIREARSIDFALDFPGAFASYQGIFESGGLRFANPPGKRNLLYLCRRPLIFQETQRKNNPKEKASALLHFIFPLQVFCISLRIDNSEFCKNLQDCFSPSATRIVCLFLHHDG